ncbi:rRNA maturation RNase YbeY [Thalassococcus sp. S3]|uniref:rRNA maturation RNase YbeY n=1 Tax=Thalassococcus sp. S3 TaxID=2017482 RepID=UPI0010240519|nr:rRNA maturation RNase YbeY [Thalassococcus sp. S3]QBF30732.1 rRNA maturation RNase YbeY [Thalassococcus sp. S3]
MSIEVILEDQRWEEADLDGLANRAGSATLRHLGLDAARCEISVLGCDDTRIAALNAEFRAKPSATNVLSWPETDLSAEVAGEKPTTPQADPIGDIPLGDIAIAYETCLREAEAAGKPLADHATHLIVHGVLHLLGYDHIRDPDATLMEGLEVQILGKLGLDSPYYGSTGA